VTSEAPAHRRRLQFSLKWTVTVMITGTGTPFSSVGVYRHCVTARKAWRSRSGATPRGLAPAGCRPREVGVPVPAIDLEAGEARGEGEGSAATQGDAPDEFAVEGPGEPPRRAKQGIVGGARRDQPERGHLLAGDAGLGLLLERDDEPLRERLRSADRREPGGGRAPPRALVGEQLGPARELHAGDPAVEQQRRRTGRQRLDLRALPGADASGSEDQDQRGGHDTRRDRSSGDAAPPGDWVASSIPAGAPCP